ncbi:MAG: HlyC/CorC family transporter [Pseudomonadota bacterium]
MNEVPVGLLFFALFFLVLLSAFFSSSETAMMAVNRYRVKSLADQGNRSAKLVVRLLNTPDKLLGTILFGNNVANIAASTIATVIGLRLFGDAGLAYAPLLLVFIVLIFAEVAPKTLAAISPERIAFPAAWVLAGLQVALSPLVWLVKFFSNGFLKLFGVSVKSQTNALSSEELSAAVKESGSNIDASHQGMLLRVLEMEQIRVEEIMVPRGDMAAIDLDDDWEDILQQLANSPHTRVPVFRGSMDDFVGVAHIRKIFRLSQSAEFTKQSMIEMIREPYFVPENTSITHALTHLQERRRRLGIVVDEYGEIKGLVTLEQILEEVVGKFTSLNPGEDLEIVAEEGGSFLIKGSTHLRDINRQLGWSLPVKGAKTLNGLITEALEEIPHASTCFRLEDYIVETVQTHDTSVNVARLLRIQ